VPPVSADAVRTILEREYGAPVESVFETFDWTPLAAASLGQVHRARWEGQDVVVKVLRPGVESLMAEDLRAAESIFAFAERRWGQGAAAGHFRGLRNVLREFGARVWEEMDFRREAEYAQAMRANFAGREGVRVPYVVPSLVRHRALVLEYMPGVRIDRLQGRVREGRLDAAELVRRVIELYMQMMLVDGLFHADPHPGNLLVQEDGTIVVLDFGMVVRVDRALRRQLARTAFAGIQRDVDGLIDGFYALGVLEPQADRATARALVEALLEIAHTVDTTTLDRMQLVADRVMATLYTFPVTLPSDLVYFARTAALIEGTRRALRRAVQRRDVRLAGRAAAPARDRRVAARAGRGGPRVPRRGPRHVRRRARRGARRQGRRGGRDGGRRAGGGGVARGRGARGVVHAPRRAAAAGRRAARPAARAAVGPAAHGGPGRAAGC
jgi:predicted unusual protein kinase regulating ubiquinone biosynthesis (AarF/ABC1/UbiB family)